MSPLARHPRHALNDLLLSPVRLSLVAALSSVDKVDFPTLRDSIEVTDSALSKQLALLEDAGHIEIGKRRVERHARTWVRLTASGTAALESHLAALHAIADLRLPAVPESPRN